MQSPDQILQEAGIAWADVAGVAAQFPDVGALDLPLPLPDKPIDLVDDPLNHCSESVIPFSFCRVSTS